MLRGGQVYRPGEEAFCSLGALLGLDPVRGNKMFDMLDWLLGRQAWIEKSLARRHLEGATLLLYDVSSSYLEGRCSPLAAFGHNRDDKQGKQQIVFGLAWISALKTNTIRKLLRKPQPDAEGAGRAPLRPNGANLRFQVST